MGIAALEAVECCPGTGVQPAWPHGPQKPVIATADQRPGTGPDRSVQDHPTAGSWVRGCAQSSLQVGDMLLSPLEVG